MTWLKGVTLSKIVNGNSCVDDIKYNGANLVFNIGPLLINDGDPCTPMLTDRKEGTKEAINDAIDVKSDGVKLDLDSGKPYIDAIDD